MRFIQKNKCAPKGVTHTVFAKVEHGAKRGRCIGFPTLNLRLSNSSLRFGVYAAYVYIHSARKGRYRRYCAVANVGITPMFKRQVPILEVHVFHFSEFIYGHEVYVSLVQFIRPEYLFAGTHTLIQRIRLDCEIARLILKRNALPACPPTQLVQ